MCRTSLLEEILEYARKYKVEPTKNGKYTFQVPSKHVPEHILEWAKNKSDVEVIGNVWDGYECVQDISLEYSPLGDVE